MRVNKITMVALAFLSIIYFSGATAMEYDFEPISPVPSPHEHFPFSFIRVPWPEKKIQTKAGQSVLECPLRSLLLSFYQVVSRKACNEEFENLWLLTGVAV